MFPPKFISIERIGCQLDIGSKKRVLQQMGDLLASSSPDLAADSIFERLLERERLGSTGLGHGVALPHARTPEVESATGAFIQLKSAVDFDAIDDRPVDLAFALLVPQEATEEHLQLLAKLAAMFSNELLCEHLRNASEPQAMLELVQEWEANPGGS